MPVDGGRNARRSLKPDGYIGYNLRSASPTGAFMPKDKLMYRRFWLFAIFSVASLLSAPIPVRGQNISGQDVQRAIRAGTDWLQRNQDNDGRWDDYHIEGGTTALATLALLNAGVSPDGPGMRRAIGVVRAIPLLYTYTVSLKIQALSAADPVRYRAEIKAAAEWLVRAQQRNGMWGYDAGGLHTDFSNSQFALLGLHEAAKAGARIPETLWRQAEKAWVFSQQNDGGWAYTPGAQPSTGSMTAAGIASLYITGNSLTTHGESGFTADGQAPRCGRYSEFRPIARGLDWLGRRFNATQNPGNNSWYFYYMYGIERVGILSGMRFLGRHDWYREGAAELLIRQRGDGSWQESSQVVDTAFSLLFLAKGHRPVLFQKLQWSADNRWNQDRNDLAHLVAFIGDRLGEPVSWEVVTLKADVRDWLAAPILYFNGHVFPTFDAAATKKLTEYVNQGGTILAEACCGRKEFADGFKAFAKVAFPEAELHRLTPDHPVFRASFKLDGSRIELYGLEIGCRTSVFFSSNDLSCLWEQANIPVKSEAAFQLGTNIAAYATGLEPLPDKLDVVRLARPTSQPGAPDVPPRGAVFIAQLMHNGDWRPDPRVIPNLAELLHDRMGVDVVPQAEPLRATDPKLAQHPIVYMTGHFTFKLSPEEIAALRRHLERGGFLFAEACCGREAFDKSFRQLASDLFPNRPLERLPQTHPIIAGSPGVPLPKVTYKPAVQSEQPNLNQVILEAIDLEGRTAVVFSPFSLGCGIDGHTCYACRGVAAPDAKQLAANIILYALSY